MDLGLSGKVAFITGGSKGIGLACAHVLAAEGVRVIICSRSQANLDKAKAGLPGVTTLAADLTDAAAALKVVQDAERLVGPIDILVTSAGAAMRTVPEELTPAKWQAAMDAKFFTYINVIDPVVKLMAERRSGVIVNVIGNGGKMASPTHIAGGAANAALMLATAGLGSAYAKHGVRVVGVNPGLTATDRVTSGLEAEAQLSKTTIEAAKSAAISRIPMGRMAEAEEIARVVCFLASSAASYVTGVTLSMDGGTTPTVI